MISAIKGFNDIRPNATDAFLDSRLWQHIFQTSLHVFQSYGYAPVWLPALEDTKLFLRGIGSETDIVSKEMYTLLDRGQRSLTLRPEGTAGAARAYIEHHLSHHEPIQKWCYQGPMFRAERPQKGRYRQFYQIGAEFFGIDKPVADAEMLRMLQQLCQRLGIHDFSIRLNTLGDLESRNNYIQALRGFLERYKEQLCHNCQTRLETNALRVLDCKQASCQAILQDAPDILKSLTSEAQAWFDALEQLLADAHITYVRDPRLVRGLDYYTGAIFEFTTGLLGSQDAFLGGGRYDNLVAQLEGASTPAVGFAAGVERLALILAQLQTQNRGPQLMILPMDAQATRFALTLADDLRNQGARSVEVELSGAKLKPGLRRANKLHAEYLIVLGPDEMTQHKARVKHLPSGQETAVALDATTICQHVSKAYSENA